MEELKNEGLTRSIGVSNYREEDFLEMEPNWTIPPAVNQVNHSHYSLMRGSKLTVRSRCTLTSSTHRMFSVY
jgi:diketogulonate reductase-like aldo/keto reductase